MKERSFMLEPKDYKISRLIARQFVHGLSSGEEEKLERWLAADPDNRRLYDRIMDSDNKAERDKYVEGLDIEKEWRALEQQLSPFKKKNRKLGWGIGIAASIALLVGVGLWFFQQREEIVPPVEFTGIQVGTSKAILITSGGEQIELQDSNVQQIVLNNGVVALNTGKSVALQGGKQDTVVREIRYSTIRIPRGGEYNLTLSDGSRVYLNSDSEIRFPEQFGEGKREVFLKGEAFFVVAKDKSHPFVVNTPNKLQVEVLGTEFNVQAYVDEEDVEATLNQGAVRVVLGNQSVELHPNQQAVYNKKSGKLSSREVDAEAYSAWKDGRFVMKNETLESIMARLSRWYDIRIFYMNPEVKNYHFSGELERYEDFSEALRMLEKSAKISFEVNKNNVVVRKRM
ncbi:FecR family protein [Sanguibacteroides justesenii]|nr:FecR domain-containing protein [Sanguibacteroides justesenii]